MRSYRNVILAEYFREYKWIFKNADSQAHPEDQVTTRNMGYHGTALGISKELPESMEEIRVQHKNIAAAMVKMKGKSLLILSVYLPTMGKDIEFEE